LGRSDFGIRLPVHGLLDLLWLDVAQELLILGIFSVTARIRLCVRPLSRAALLLIQLGKIDGPLRTVPVNLHALAAAEEFVVLQAKAPRFGPVKKIRGINLTVERDGKADVSKRPVLAQPRVKGTGDVDRLVVRQQRFDLSRKLALMFG